MIKIAQSIRNFQPVAFSNSESNDFYKTLATFQHVRSLTDCEVSVVRVLTPREFRTLPPVKFSLAEILVSGLRCTVSTDVPIHLSVALSLLSRRSSINVTNGEYGLFMKGNNRGASVRDTNREMDVLLYDITIIPIVSFEIEH